MLHKQDNLACTRIHIIDHTKAQLFWINKMQIQQFQWIVLEQTRNLKKTWKLQQKQLFTKYRMCGSILNLLCHVGYGHSRSKQVETKSNFYSCQNARNKTPQWGLWTIYFNNIRWTYLNIFLPKSFWNRYTIFLLEHRTQ